MVKWNKEQRDEVKMYLSNDYEIDSETTEYILMTKKTATAGGHIVVFLLTVWFTLGIGNLIYWFLANKKHKIMK